MNLARLPGFFYLFLVSIALIAQPPRDPAPLKYWPAPLYWQPTQASTTCTIPSNAQAYSFNLTVVPPAAMYYLTIWPLGATQPNASTLNDLPGTVLANAAIVPAGNDSSGSVNVFVSNTTDLIIDINGYYAAQSGITLTQGSASAPSLSFSGDPTTGIFSSSAGSVSIVGGGVSRITVRPNGDVDIPGSIRKDGALFLHNLGDDSTAVGLNALSSNTAGSFNTASGWSALLSNTTGNSNVAVGTAALQSNTTGSINTATGAYALANNTIGSSNTASGNQALQENAAGDNNTAVGSDALQANTAGGGNTATGTRALLNNTTGSNNIAIGYQAAAGVSGTNSNNIHIGNQGLSADTAAIKIGT